MGRPTPRTTRTPFRVFPRATPGGGPVGCRGGPRPVPRVLERAYARRPCRGTLLATRPSLTAAVPPWAGYEDGPYPFFSSNVSSFFPYKHLVNVKGLTTVYSPLVFGFTKDSYSSIKFPLLIHSPHTGCPLSCLVGEELRYRFDTPRPVKSWRDSESKDLLPPVFHSWKRSTMFTT